MNTTNRKYAEFFNERVGTVIEKADFMNTFGIKDKMRSSIRIPRSLHTFCAKYAKKGLLKKFGPWEYKVISVIDINVTGIPNTKPVLKFDSKGNQVGCFFSINDAIEESGLAIYVVRGSIAASKSGFRWELDTKSK